MKRIVSCLVCLLMLLALALPCAAAPADCVRLDTDLSEDETAYLGVLFDLIKNTYGVEAFFLVNYDYEGGDTFKAYAKDYLRSHAAGDDALIFAVSSTTYYMNALGKAGELIEDDDLDQLYEAIRAADENGEQYNAAVQFYSALLKLAETRNCDVVDLTYHDSDPSYAGASYGGVVGALFGSSQIGISSVFVPRTANNAAKEGERK